MPSSFLPDHQATTIWDVAFLEHAFRNCKNNATCIAEVFGVFACCNVSPEITYADFNLIDDWAELAVAVSNRVDIRSARSGGPKLHILPADARCVLAQMLCKVMSKLVMTPFFCCHCSAPKRRLSRPVYTTNSRRLTPRASIFL